MLKQHVGFNLIELMIVTIILGLLGAVAIPKFLHLKHETHMAAIKGIADAISSANKVNHTTRRTNTSKGIAVVNCTDLSRMVQGGLPLGYVITPKSIAVNSTTNCTLTGPDSSTATFQATGTH